MARLFPNKLPGKALPEVLRVFRKLKKLPDEFSVWYSLSDSESAPHFLLIWRERFAFLVHVASTSQQLAESALQPEMFGSAPSLDINDLGREEIQVLEEFQHRLAEKYPEPLPLRHLVVFPNVSQNTLDAVTLHRGELTETNFLNIHQLGDSDLPLLLESFTSEALDSTQVIHLRHTFTPEMIVPVQFSSLSPLQKPSSNTTASVFTGLLDLDQEWCVKNNLYLPDEAMSIAEGGRVSEEPATYNHHLVTGVAGSGKSLVLLYRALLNNRLRKNARVLVLTHNKAINHELKDRFSQLESDAHTASRIEWRTFFGWASHLMPKMPENIISPKEVKRILGETLAVEKLCNHSVEFVMDEIGFIKDHRILEKESYLSMPRTGRGKPLNANQREVIWHILGLYQNHLSANKMTDWHGVALLFHQLAVTDRRPFARYDYILIDEAQFFAKVWFDIVSAALRPGGEIFLAADPTQGFLKRRQSWLASGIDIRGRSRQLRRAYRNSRAILHFAKAFCAMRGVDASENPDFNLPTEKQISDIPVAGTAPDIILCPNIQDLNQRAVNEIVSLRESGLRNGQVLILHACSQDLGSFKASLQNALGNGLVHDAKDGARPTDSFCQVCTLNAGTGLEAPIVFLLGIDSLLEKEQLPFLPDDEKQELQQTHTQKLYMAITRAGQRLLIFSKNPQIHQMLKQCEKTHG